MFVHFWTHFRHVNWHLRVLTSKAKLKPRKSLRKQSAQFEVLIWLWNTMEILLFKKSINNTSLSEVCKVFPRPNSTYKWNSESPLLSLSFSGFLFCFEFKTHGCKLIYMEGKKFKTKKQKLKEFYIF